jgi:putative flavoprotein involved in K+ transport
LDRVGRRVTLKPKHIVFATGAYGPPRRIDLPGSDLFQGDLLHSSQYSSGEKFRGRRVAVIGAASSGHDVCVDLWESGAKVTMIQRSPTTVVKSDTLMDVGFEIFWRRRWRAGSPPRRPT